MSTFVSRSEVGSCEVGGVAKGGGKKSEVVEQNIGRSLEMLSWNDSQLKRWR